MGLEKLMMSKLLSCSYQLFCLPTFLTGNNEMVKEAIFLDGRIEGKIRQGAHYALDSTYNRHCGAR